MQQSDLKKSENLDEALVILDDDQLIDYVLEVKSQ